MKKNKPLKILVFNFNNVLTDVIEELKNRGHIILPLDGKESTAQKADVIVLWNETNLGGWKDWIRKYRENGKKVILVQHGRRGTSRIYPPFNEKLESEIVCIWGEADRKRLTSCGVPNERIHTTGTTIFKHLKPRIKHDGFNVIFSPEHWGGVEVAENFIINSTLQKLTKENKNVKVITKLLENEHNPNIYQNPVVSHRGMLDHLDICADVLSIADMIVGVSESTFEMLAQTLDIPIVIADIWVPKASSDGDERYKLQVREYSKGCTRIKDITKLNETIMYHLKHPELLREERKQTIIDDGGYDIKDSLDRICNLICSK